MQGCTCLINGKIEKALLGQVLPSATQNLPTDVRPASMHQQGKIHSYLFSSLGFLLHANDAAIDDWRSRGNIRIEFQIVEFEVRNHVSRGTIKCIGMLLQH